ncbi:MAG: T9SS type A sorting domain-containing protein [Bacteroidia bacterium]|nr:T9SS type A sorting domain-containing protein [Bacteroidia bacterium]
MKKKAFILMVILSLVAGKVAGQCVTVGSDITVCQGATAISLGGSVINGTTTVVWSGGEANGSFSDVNDVNSTWTPLSSYYGIVTLTLTSTAGCAQPIKSASLTITVLQTPTASISGTTSVCEGAIAPNITFTNTLSADVTITYNINGDAPLTIDVNASSTATVASSTTSAGSFVYNLESVAYKTGTACSSSLSGSATITVNPLPGSIAGTTNICVGSNTPLSDSPAGGSWYSSSPSIASVVASTGVVTGNLAGTCVISYVLAVTGCYETAIVTVDPNVVTPVFAMGATSVRCQGAGTVTYAATATNSTGITYTLDTDSETGSNVINPATGEVTYVAGWSGTSIITATATGCNGTPTATHTVTINSSVVTPVFTLGAASTRCQGVGMVTYTATATNNTGITYSLDSFSTSGGNSIDAGTGEVTYVAGWSGTSIITATAAGCNGPKTASHAVTITPSVGTPVFTLGATSTRCQGAGSVTYAATATNNTGITYTLDTDSETGLNTIDPATGQVTYVAGWSGTSIITATATGCNGTPSAIHTVTINQSVVTPVFILGATSTRCQGAGSVTYTATATNNTGITYTLDGASLVTNSIDAATGQVTYAAGWSGTSIITATATGCNGTPTATHTVTVNPVSAGGSIAGTTAVCSGTNSTSLTLSSYTGSILKWQYSTDDWATVGDIPINTTGYTATNLSTTTKYRAVIQSGVCPSVNSVEATVTVKPLPIPTLTGPAAPRETSTGNKYDTEPGMTNYVWGGFGTPATDYIITSGGLGSTDPTVTLKWLTTGMKHLTIIYTTNGCTSSSPTEYDVDVKPLPLASNVTITGTPEVGRLLAGSYTYTDGAGYDEGASICEWYRNGPGTPLVGIGKTYIPDNNDVDKTLTFKVTPLSSSTDLPNEGITQSATTAIVSSSGLPVASEVCIDGIRAVGQKLTGKYKYSYYKAQGNSTYRWLRNGIPTDSTRKYFVLRSQDIADDVSITFEVTPVSVDIPPIKTGQPVQSYPLARFDMVEDTYSDAVSEVTLEADPMGGIFSGTGVTNGKFSPNSVGVGTYTIQYQINIVNPSVTCSQQASKILNVSESGISFNFDDHTICADDPQFTISVQNIPVDAVPYHGYGFFFNWDPYFWYNWYDDITYWYHNPNETDPRIVTQMPLSGVPNVDNGAVPYVDDATTPWSVTIDPSKLTPGIGNNILYLYYYYNYNYYLLQLSLNVESVGTVTRISNLNQSYCADDLEQEITVEGFPAGGSYDWTVTGGSILTDTDKEFAKLNPASGLGTFTINYQYTSLNGCKSNMFPQDVTINPLPDVTFTLNDSYNIDSGAVTLTTDLPPGSLFVGNGVYGNKLFPDLAGTGLDIITYSIKDANLCYDELTKQTTIRKAQGTIVGLPSVVCYRDTTYNVTATGLPPGVSVLDFTNKKNTILHTPGATNADYNILTAGAGSDTLIFSYLWDGVDYAISTVVNVDSIGQVVIKNLLPGDIVCANLAPFEMFTSPSGGVFSGPVTGGYLDPSKAMGSTSVSYKYTNLKTGCSATTVVPFKISPEPNVSFVPADVCVVSPADTTFFTNNTVSSDTVKSWLWEFSEPGGSKTSNLKEPGYLYTTGSFHAVTLTATTVNNCISSKTITIDLGIKPIADFYWENECYHANDSIMLFDSTFSISPIVSQSWNFFDGGTVITEQNPVYPKNLPGDLKVQHIVKTSYANCTDTITRNIYIRPTITLATDPYFENFESGDGGWVKGDEAINNWTFGNPDRDVINTAASGDHAWYTSYDILAQTIESSSVISPCFDFTTSERPMIRLKLWRRFEMNRDGAALQYKIKEGPWQYVGTLDDGINWFNSTLIKGRPGGDQIGWTTIGTPDSEWIEARHTLDELIGNKDVKFRISYGSDGTSQNNDGIAFDDILIGERTRNVLLEHFENSSDTKSSAATTMVNTIAQSNSKDVINIQYHTNFPGTDPYYNDNPGDASARILFYGLIKVPYSFVDGGNNSQEFAKMYEYVIAKIDSNDIRKRSLINPRFDISITKTISGSVLNVSVKLTALEVVEADNLTLYLAVTEKKNNVYTGAAGDTVFYNIFRKFIPDAGGINLKKSWAKGDSIIFSDQSWVIEKIKNSSDIEVVAFVQNNITKELYQAYSEIETKITVGIENMFSGKGNDFALYPNPAVKKLTIAFKEPLSHDSEIRIYNIQGIVIALYKAGSGLSEFTIENPGLRGGIYLVRVTAGSIDLGFRKLIISGD